MIDLIDKCNDDKDVLIQQIQQMQEAHKIAELHAVEEMRVEDIENQYEDEAIRQRAAEERALHLEAEKRSKTPLQRLQNALSG